MTPDPSKTTVELIRTRRGATLGRWVLEAMTGMDRAAFVDMEFKPDHVFDHERIGELLAAAAKTGRKVVIRTDLPIQDGTGEAET